MPISENYALMTSDGHCVQSNSTETKEVNFYGIQTKALRVQVQFKQVSSTTRGRIENMLPLLTTKFVNNSSSLAQPSIRSSLAQLSLDGRVLWKSLEFKRQVMNVVFELVAPDSPEIIDHLKAFLTRKKHRHALSHHPLEVSRIFIPGEKSLLTQNEIQQQIENEEISFTHLKSISDEGVINQRANNCHYETSDKIKRKEFARFFVGQSGRTELKKLQTKKDNGNGALIPKNQCFISDVTINTGQNYGILETNFKNDGGHLCHQTPSHLDPGSTGNRQIEVSPLEKDIRQKNIRVHWQLHKAHPNTRKRCKMEAKS